MRRSILTTGGSLLHLLKPTTAASGLTAHIYHRHTHQFPLKPNTCAARTLFTAMASKAGPAPPQAPNDFSYDASAITETVKAAIERTRSLEDGIGSLKPEDCTFETVVKPLALDEAVLDTQTDPACFMQSVSTNKLVRDAATEATMKLSDFGIESSMRKDIYEALQHAQQNTQANSLDAESQRLLDRMLRDKRRAGLGLPEDKQKRYKEIKTQISNKCIEFRKVCDEESGFLLFTKSELDGVPEGVVAGYPQEQLGDTGTQYKVTHKTPDIVPVLRYAKVPATRRKAYLSYENRTASNAKLFKEILELRKEAADIMGYESHADYVIEPKMAKTAKAALDFLEDLHAKIKPIGEKERDKLMKLKEEECKELRIPFENIFYAWDYRYYDRLYTERTLKLDDELVKEYLPVDVVIPRIMKLYEDMLGVQSFPVKDATTWHEDVTVWAVWDKEGLEGSKPEDAFQGYLYLDLFPREAKYGHAAVWGLIPGYERADGSRQYPTSAMVANLAKATGEKPALLSHYDFVTFFHEMGHAWHGLLSRTKYARFHGTHVARDFVEAPSQMLENWCFSPKVLKQVSSHYKSGEPMPDELVEKIIKSDEINKGLFNLRQLYFGLFDLRVHTSKEALDYTEFWNKLREDVALTSIGDAQLPEGQASFAHLVGGYDAGYYGYLYSLSFATDMFSTVFAKDPLDGSRGLLYRKEILLPGGSREESESLEAFLGRVPNNEAFMKKLMAGASA